MHRNTCPSLNTYCMQHSSRTFSRTMQPELRKIDRKCVFERDWGKEKGNRKRQTDVGREKVSEHAGKWTELPAGKPIDRRDLSTPSRCALHLPTFFFLLALSWDTSWQPSACGSGCSCQWRLHLSAASPAPHSGHHCKRRRRKIKGRLLNVTC